MDDFDIELNKMVDLADKIPETILKMGKNARSNIVVDGYNFDSNEELDFYYWVLEAKDYGFIDDFIYQPPSFVLYPGYKNEKGKFIIREHIYTADFKIQFSDKWIQFRKDNNIKVFDKFDEKTTFIDVKGGFNRFGGDRGFSINLKWVFAKYGIYIWKIKPFEFFHKKTWLPKKSICTRKTGKVRAKYAGVKIFEKHGYIFENTK